MKYQTNEEKIKAWDLKIRYYYIPFGAIDKKSGKPTNGKATIAIVQVKADVLDETTEFVVGEFVYARGIAFCSPRDQFCRKTGRDKALGRAIKALGTLETTERVSKTSAAVVLRENHYPKFLYLTEFNAALTDYEKVLFEVK